MTGGDINTINAVPSPDGIAINNYNYGRFFVDAISSALNQTYRNVEVVPVDDGSADDSRELVQSFGKGIKVVLNEKCPTKVRH